MSEDTPKFWYIAVSRDGGKNIMPVFGPCNTRENADHFSRRVKNAADDLDPWATFYEWYTVALPGAADGWPRRGHTEVMRRVFAGSTPEEVAAAGLRGEYAELMT